MFASIFFVDEEGSTNAYFNWMSIHSRVSVNELNSQLELQRCTSSVTSGEVPFYDENTDEFSLFESRKKRETMLGCEGTTHPSPSTGTSWHVVRYVLPISKYLLRFVGGENWKSATQLLLYVHHEAYYRPHGPGFGLCLHHHFSFCQQGCQALDEVRFVMV